MNNKEILDATIDNYRRKINLNEAYNKSIKYKLKKYLLQEVSNFGDKGYTILDNKKLLDILHPNQDNKVSDMTYINIRRIADIFDIRSTRKYQNIDYKKGIYLTKDINIGLYPLYGKYDAFNDYDASYSKLVAYFITPDKKVNKAITDTIWLEEGSNSN